MMNSIETHIRPLAVAIAATVMVLTLALSSVAPARAEMKIQEVTSPKGVSAWLVEDYSVPLISIRFAFEGGFTQDPRGKEGLANLMTGLFDEGAGDLDSEAFQSRLDDAGAEMGFGETRDTLYGSMRLLADQKDEALQLLRLAITEPRFDQAPIDRIRSQIVSNIISSSRDPEVAAQVKWSAALYGDHPYARRDEGTQETLATITADDLRAFHKAIFARENLKVAVVGAIDAETLKGELDRLFGDLPQKPTLTPIADVQPKLGQEVRFEYQLPQALIQLAYPGIERDDPAFFDAVLMNHILGGGTFTSRLFDEVREKRGLAYGISSSLVNYDHANALVIGTSTRAVRADETLNVIRDIVRGMAEEGPTEAELDAAKKYLIGAYAINNLDSSSAIARTLLELQIEELGIDYIDRRAALIEAVTLEGTREAAKRLLRAEPAVLIVGPPPGGGKE
ncbi:M16 family metallopeptidase [Pseudaminobacter sp. NGMCC 1.201702]|uniref:M16 family metallopeptidase n=1 Tax=Pseudaminobacter sp. NGMCC 1.201702 TaxID=3391825 RepID=UPI0039F01BD0